MLLAGAVESVLPRWFGGSDSTDGASWIWSPSVELGNQSAPTPTAFFAVLDFELDGSGSASMSLMADETYVLYLNGRPIGSGGYRHGVPLDRYRLDPVVRVGANRAIVELRSSRGIGGLIAVLHGGEPERVVARTGCSWKIVEGYQAGIFGGDQLPENLPCPRDFGPSPSGRWRLASGSLDRPLRDDTFPPPQRIVPRRARTESDPADELTEAWIELPAEPAIELPRGPAVLVDWGREVTGALTIELALEARQTGLVFLGSEPPDPRVSRPACVVVPFPDRGWWRAALEHRFRYALLVGVEYQGGAWVEESESPGSFEPWSPIWDRGLGESGLDPGPTDVLLEEAMWNRFGWPHPSAAPNPRR